MRWRGVPILAFICAALALLMLPPAAMAALNSQWRAAQAFADGALFAGLVATGIAAAFSRPERTASRARDELLSVVFAFTLAPAVAAFPLWLHSPWLGLDGAYFEMVSMLTTTGATVYADLSFAPEPIHVWRALTAWFGGLVTLIFACAVFAPRNLGGFEVAIAERQGQVGRLAGAPAWAGGSPGESSDARLARAVRLVLAPYALLTALAGCLFAAMGAPALTAFAQAAGVMSTCAVTTNALGFEGGVGAEAAAVLFMAAAATRRLYSGGAWLRRLRLLRNDPELELAAIAVLAATIWIFLRHWVGDLEEGRLESWRQVAHALWGAFFTSVSFLTTTGYVSDLWEGARIWSGAEGAGFMMVGLAAMGGGVASTAGGVKLLRSFALYRQGVREIGKLSEPRAVHGLGEAGRRVGVAGASFAFIFVILFILSVGGVALILSGLGMGLDRALISAMATLSNAGSGLKVALGADAPGYDALGAAERLVLCAAMALGRVEILAVIALANPSYWRR